MIDTQKFVPRSIEVEALQFTDYTSAEKIMEWVNNRQDEASSIHISRPGMEPYIQIDNWGMESPWPDRSIHLHQGMWLVLNDNKWRVLYSEDFERLYEPKTEARIFSVDFPVEVDRGHLVIPLDNPDHTHTWGFWEYGGPKGKFFIPMDRWYRKCTECTERQILEIFEEGKK